MGHDRMNCGPTQSHEGQELLPPLTLAVLCTKVHETLAEVGAHLFGPSRQHKQTCTNIGDIQDFECAGSVSASCLPTPRVPSHRALLFEREIGTLLAGSDRCCSESRLLPLAAFVTFTGRFFPLQLAGARSAFPVTSL